MKTELDTQTEILLILKKIHDWIKVWSIIGIVMLIIAAINYIYKTAYL